MRKSKESTVINMEINEEKEIYNFRYTGNPTKVIAHLLTSIVFVLKHNGCDKLSPRERQGVCDSFAASIRKGLETDDK